MIDTVKGAFKSITMWFNGILSMVWVAIPIIQDSMPQLASLLPDNVYKHLTLVLVVGNILLRAKTSQPLKDK